MYMNTAVINIKTEKILKKRVQNIASDFGLSLSALINVYLKQLVRTRRIELDLGEEPSNYLKSIIKQAEINYSKKKIRYYQNHNWNSGIKSLTYGCCCFVYSISK